MPIKPKPSLGSWLAAISLLMLITLWFLLPPSGGPEDVLALAPAERGLLWAGQQGCLACHSLDGSQGIGPSWLGSYGKSRNFQDGSTAIADEAYLLRAIRQPQAEVVAGFNNLMLPATLNDEQLLDVVALIRSLADKAVP